VGLRGEQLPRKDRLEYGSAAMYRVFVEDEMGQFDRAIRSLMLDE
jgi:hypothetical protein